MNQIIDRKYSQEFIDEITRVLDILRSSGDVYGFTTDTFNNVLREWNSDPQIRSWLTAYYRMDFCYIIIEWDKVLGYPDVGYEIPREILKEWQSEICRDGLEANAYFPTNKEMLKMLRKPTNFLGSSGKLFKRKHGFQRFDSTPLIDRIYAVHEYLG